MRNYFEKCFDFVCKNLGKDDVVLARFSGEESDFCRFNKAQIRQLGSVKQMNLHCTFVRDDKKQTQLQTEISGDWSLDSPRLQELVKEGEKNLLEADMDPYILFNRDVQNSEYIAENHLPGTDKIIAAIVRDAKDLDLVGILACGKIANGFANSFGQRNWYESHSFNWDWSLYHHSDKAVKGAYSGFVWDENVWQQKLKSACQQLEILARPAKVLRAGVYRSFLAPSAMSEIFDLLNWGGFSLKKLRSKQSSLCLLAEGDRQLHPQFTLAEHTARGLSPNFDMQGYIKPEKTMLIQDGKYAGSLVSARSAKEYGVTPLGCNDYEMAESLHLLGGDLQEDKILSELGTGLYVNNLWYMNYSDRHSCRLTGMTRFATLWVEDGKIVAPVDVMRFDDCFYEMFGERLLGLTREESTLIGNMTYDRRETTLKILPGALIEDFNLTL